MQGLQMQQRVASGYLASSRCSQATKLVSVRGKPSRHQRTLVRVSAQAVADLLAEGRKKYDSGDPLAALSFYENALARADISQRERQEALYGTLAVHAAFGDVELAQMTLRDAIQAGLDFERAQNDPAFPELTSSPQILIQLNRFNKQVLTSMAARAEDRAAATAASARAAKRSGRASLSRVAPDADLSALLGGAAKGSDSAAEEGIDASPAAIAKRVALVVLAGIALGVALFFLGLEYMFPKLD